MRKKRKKRSSPTSKYRSGFEAKLAHQLQRGGVAFEYETLKLEYRKVATYTPDFILPNGIIIEAKGVWTVEDRTKHLLVREQHPHLDIRLVFMNAFNKIRKRYGKEVTPLTLVGAKRKIYYMQINKYQNNGFYKHTPTLS
jgi:hypothetical protein